MTETNAERLERLKNHSVFEHLRGKFLVPHETYLWLIEQAEYVKDLEVELKSERERNQSLSEESRGNFQASLDYRRENERSREALEFYANNENYQVNVENQWGPEINVMMDGGNKACLALEDDL